MSLRIIKDNEIGSTFDDQVVLIDMEEPGLYAVQRDPSFLLSNVTHEYVCFDCRRGEVVRIGDDAIEALREMTGG